MLAIQANPRLRIQQFVQADAASRRGLTQALALMSRFGLILCSLYVAISVLCVWGSFDAGVDSKGSFILLQLPLIFQLEALGWLGFRPLLTKMSWPVAYASIGSLTLVLLYGTGWFIGSLFKRVLAVSRHAR
jgi:hypothetical protein